MSALMIAGNSAACGQSISNSFAGAKLIFADCTSPLCEILVSGQVLTGVYDRARRHLTVPSPSTKLSQQPQDVSALVCCTRSGVGATSEFMALLTAENGATIVLPREGATNATEILVRENPEDSDLSHVTGRAVAVARGPDPYAVLLDAVQLLAKETGAQYKDVHAYALPLMDATNRLRFDAPVVSVKSSGQLANVASLKAALEQQLHKGILVQAGPGCPAKPLLQAPGLRVCQGRMTSLGLRYSGMSVVYGTATGHVLAVMETAAALKMVPVGVLHPFTSHSAGHLSSDADSPSAVSAGASAATSTTPSPTLTRSNSISGDATGTDMITSLATTPPAAVTRSPHVVLSGRSITAAPIIHVLSAVSGSSCTGRHAGIAVSATPTGVPAQVLASFALLGFKTAGGRMGALQCCRIMPASTVLSTVPYGDEENASVGTSGLGLVVRVEVSCASSGTVLLFVEGADVNSDDEGQDDLNWVDTAALPVRRVTSQGREARWRYNGTGCILSVELPPAPEAHREIEIFI